MKPVAIVTGGRRGIGQGIALALADKSFDIVIVDVVEDHDVADTLEQLKRRGSAATFIRADIADADAASKTADAAFSAFGRIDVLVNNAGVQARSYELDVDVLDTSIESFDRVVGINLRGTFFLTQAVAKRMVQASDTSDSYRAIVTVSSINAHQARTKTPEYCISKSGLSMLNRVFALRLAAHRIACFEVLPGLIETAMTSPNHELLDPIVRQGLSPIARWGQPTDVGKTIASLASGALPFSTGDAIYVDGGMHVPSSPLEPPYAVELLRALHSQEAP